MHKSTAPDSNGATVRARRIELFYGLHGLSGSERSIKCIELLEDKKYPFLYPDPLVSSPPLSCHVANITGTQEKIFPWRDLEFHTLFPLQRL
jgi:hypothetical protein